MKKKTGMMLFAVALGTFMSALDASVVNIAVPVIKEHFGVTLATVQWVITAYLIVVSSLLLFFGRLSDLYGQKRVYLAGFAVFTAGSALCAFSASVEMLIVLRVVQALGAGMMFSTGSAIITHNVPAKNRGKAFSVTAIAVAVALSTGPVLGGALTDALGWQSIFYINIPVGAVGIFLAAKFIPADRKEPSAPIDIPGSVMIFGALFLILLPLDQLNEGMDTYLIIAMFVSGVILAALFIRHQKRTRYPLLNLSLFRSRVFSASLLAAVLAYMAQYIMVFLAPFYLQTIRLYAPSAAGLLYIPMPLATLAVAPLAGIIADKSDTRFISSAGVGVMAVGLLLLSFLDVSTPLWYIIAAMAVTGMGFGMFQTPNNSAIMSSIPADFRGVASGMLSTARNIGMVLGVGVSGAVFSFFSARAAESLAQQGIAGTAAEKGAFVSGLHITFIVACVVALASTAASLTKGKVKTPGMIEDAQKN
ncbi:MAG: MFS transporter [Eubacteriales bacterium]|nr:MFS transporter [Eubacteriales bacterium]